MNEFLRKAILFEELVEKFFKHLGYKTIIPKDSNDNGIDLIIEENEVFAGVEIKFSYSNSGSPRAILKTAKNVAYKLKENYNTIDIGILVISTVLGNDVKKSIFFKTGISVWDRSEILGLASTNIELRNNFEKLFVENSILEYQVPKISKSNFENPIPSIKDQSNLIKLKGRATPKKGEKICKQLRSIPTGKGGWRNFEKKINEAIQYIFDIELSGWKEQLTTDGGIHRYDLIGRISSNHDYWKSLSRYFNSKYVLFDAKNYTNEIKQGEILTTEKYLYKNALRSCGFIIARNGADENAKLTAKGALRENGKLIQILDLEEICTLLKLKDENEDPSSLLSDKLDELLMTITR